MPAQEMERAAPTADRRQELRSQPWGIEGRSFGGLQAFSARMLPSIKFLQMQTVRAIQTPTVTTGSPQCSKAPMQLTRSPHAAAKPPCNPYAAPMQLPCNPYAVDMQLQGYQAARLQPPCNSHAAPMHRIDTANPQAQLGGAGRPHVHFDSRQHNGAMGKKAQQHIPTNPSRSARGHTILPSPSCQYDGGKSTSHRRKHIQYCKNIDEFVELMN